MSEIKKKIIKKPFMRRWTAKEEQFVEAIKKHKILYTYPVKEMKYERFMQSQVAWQRVAAEVDMPAQQCKTKWDNMKKNFKYALMNPEKLSKFTDGYLDFVKPHIMALISAKPSKMRVPKKLAIAVSASNDSTDDDSKETTINVDEQRHMEIVEHSSPKIEIESMSILPNEEDYESDGDVTEYPSVENNLDIAENPENNLEAMVPLLSADVVDGNVNNTTQTNFSKGHILKNTVTQKNDEICELSQNQEKDSSPDSLSDFLVKYDENCDTNNIKQYFQDLADVLCSRLAPRKRTRFLSQIDLIVSNILEADGD